MADPALVRNFTRARCLQRRQELALRVGALQSQIARLEEEIVDAQRQLRILPRNPPLRRSIVHSMEQQKLHRRQIQNLELQLNVIDRKLAEIP